MSQRKIGVIGAGLAGLACAYELQKAGNEVLVLEKEGVVGGRASSRMQEELPFDLGAQIVSLSYSQARAYSQELGITDQWREIPDHVHHLYQKNALHLASYDNLGTFLRYSYLSPLARVRLLLFISWMRLRSRSVDFFNLSTGTQFDTENAYDFALKWAGKEIADNVVDTLIGAYHFHDARDLSLGAFMGCLNHFTNSFTFHRLVKDINVLAEALANRLPIRTSTSVTSVTTGREHVELQADGERLTFDAVVFATPGLITQQIYHTPSLAQAEFLKTVRYSSTITVGFRVPALPIGHLSLAIIPAEESPLIASYLFPLKGTWSDNDGQTTLLIVFCRETGAHELMHQPNGHIFDRIKTELLSLCPPLRAYATEVQPYDLQRWPAGMPKYYPGYIRHVSQFWHEGQGDHNVFFCGDYLNTPWMEGTIRCGKRVAELVDRS